MGHFHFDGPLAPQIQGPYSLNSYPLGRSRSEKYTPEFVTRSSQVLLISSSKRLSNLSTHSIPTVNCLCQAVITVHCPKPTHSHTAYLTGPHAPKLTSVLPANGISERTDRVLSCLVSWPITVYPYSQSRPSTTPGPHKGPNLCLPHTWGPKMLACAPQGS